MARLACRLFDAPLATVAVADDTAARHYTWPNAATRAEALAEFCHRVIRHRTLLAEPDLGPDLGSAVGIPFGVGGALCVFGIARGLTDEALADLTDLAHTASQALDRRREAELRSHAEESLLAERNRLAAIVESLPFNFWVCDASGRYRLQNAYGRRIWADHIGLRPADTEAPPDLKAHWTETNRRALAGEVIRTESSYEVGGETVHVEELLAPILNDDGSIWGLVGVNLDIGERKRAELRLAEAEARLRAAIESLPFDFWITDADGRYVMTNATSRKHWGDHLGREPAETGLDATVSTLWEDTNRRVLAGETLRYEVCYPNGGQCRDVEAIMAPVVSGERVIGLVGVNIDITERKRAEERMRHLADHDALTGLPNRRRFQDRLARAISRSRRRGEGIALLLMDLDDFKGVNDACGHDTGDALLCEVARRLRIDRRDEDTVARFGGDEFALVLEGMHDPLHSSRVAARIMAELRRPFSFRGQDLHPSGSIGIAVYPGDASDAAELLKHADLALYRAKQAGRGEFHHFEAEMRVQIDRRRRVERDIRRGLAADEFTVFYQPILPIDHSGRLSFEALLRWRHPDRGLVAPPEFLGVAEETGLIVAIGRVVLERVTEQIRRWVAAGVPLGRVAINLADAQFGDGDLAAMVASVLAQAGVPSELIELEVTEGVFFGRNAGRVEQALQRLHDHGVSIVLDDFGTGHASLTHLRRFPIDKLKVDRSFVRDMLDDANDAVIVRAIIDLGHSLGLEIVAEGVESSAQLDFLRSHGCDHIQGFLVAPPAWAPEALALAQAYSGVGTSAARSGVSWRPAPSPRRSPPAFPPAASA
ncbi:MAG: EAL domain-containing protein [Geminicoccaceae bacterium]